MGEVVKRPLPEAMAAHTWRPGQSGNPSGRPRTPLMVQALFDLASKDGRVEMAVNTYFDLMLHSNDPRLRFEVLKDFFDRMGMRPSTAGDAKLATQIINVVRGNSPELNL